MKSVISYQLSVISLMMISAFSMCSGAENLADLNGDTIVNFFDFRIFANDWHSSTPADANCDFNIDGIVDYKDLSVIASEWLGEVSPPNTPDMNAPPTAYDSNISTNNYLTIPITLSAIDDGRPNPPNRRKYTIVSADCNLQDASSGAGIFEPNDSPYTLSSGGNTVWFTTDSTGIFDINWLANDYGIAPRGGNSNTAKVHITVSEHPRDYISLNEGFLTIANSDIVKLTGHYGFLFWLKTRDIDGTILTKIQDENGIEIGIEDGKLLIAAYLNGIKQTLKSDNYIFEDFTGIGTISDGQWHHIQIDVNSNDINTICSVMIDAETLSGGKYINFKTFTGKIDCNNSADLIIGPAKMDIDRLCLYNNWSDGLDFDMATVFIMGRSATTYFGSPPSLEWRFNEGSGTVTYDTILNIPAVFSDSQRVSFKPFNFPFYDATVQGAR